MKRFITAVLGLIFSQVIMAQETLPVDSLVEPVRPAILTRLNVEQDTRLDKMLNWHIQQNTKINGIEGFRVEIFFSSEADAFDKASK